MHIRTGSRIAASPGVRVDAQRKDKRASARARDEQGQALLEFAFVLPLLVTLMLGMIVFGIALNNYMELTNAATAGAQALSISRGQTLNPCTTVTGPFYAAAPNLTQANVLFTITITPPPGGSGSSYTLVSKVATPSCGAASTTSPPASDLLQGDTATVTVTYPCNLKVFGVNFAPNPCNLTAQTAESIQ
jgi:Flp pilus assembly protein TadG